MNGEEPLVTVITPVRNGEPYLAQAIESVLGQTYRNFEYLIVDNASTDESRATAARYAARDSRIRVVAETEFLDQISNFNRAVRLMDPGRSTASS
ncbi:MAG: glycosyltransferase [Gemmatimonadales bacterium]